MHPPEAVSDLGTYLRRARERARPEDYGLKGLGPRRVPGLRREEVAALAGVSPSYYARLEQAQRMNVSAAVLEAIAGALRLSADEHNYLLQIGGEHLTASRETPSGGALDPHTEVLVRGMEAAAAAVLNPRCDILSWNTTFHQFFAPHLDVAIVDDPARRPNLIGLNFLDAAVQSLYLDWETESQQNVSYLRYRLGSYPGDAELASLVAGLTSRSERFASVWDGHLVANCTTGTKDFVHPVLGRLSLMYQSAELGDGNILKFYYAEPNSTAEDLLRKLTPNS